ncbi:uncharacterized protein V6R79_003283 [Siganus canaliculatus]
MSFIISAAVRPQPELPLLVDGVAADVEVEEVREGEEEEEVQEEVEEEEEIYPALYTAFILLRTESHTENKSSLVFKLLLP